LRIIVLLGPPGSGKGTLASDLVNCSGRPVFVTGEVLRATIAQGTELGRKIKTDVESGRLVDDSVILALTKEFIDKHPQGVILDGFPRTLPQAQGLREILRHSSTNADIKVIYLDASEKNVVTRLKARRVCVNCGAIFNLNSHPPKQDGICDTCGSLLEVRKDDTEDVIKERLNIYLEQTSPLIDYFADELIKINANLSSDEVFAQVKDQLCQE